ncbi:MAG: sugar kinase [Clostridia bacterium]|nr:sugar kinase [Clostridia bacterium]MBQ8513481.1 sugar kinase [Clostridia bacterium]
MITCFGETMLRLSPPGAYRIAQAQSFDIVFGGAESNVGIALANFGENVRWVSKMPENEIADACLSWMRSFGMDVSKVVRGGKRMGVFFLEKGASLRPSKVIYDRKGSAISEAQPADFDWKRILDGTDAFFFTGITPAIGETLPGITADALAVCREKKIPVFCDINYRPTLWTPEEAGPTMQKLIRGLDTLVANEEHADLLLGVKSDLTGDDKLRDIAEKLAETYEIGRVVLTLRQSHSSDDNTVSAVMYDSQIGEFVKSKEYRVHIVDRVGGGDALSAGLIYCTKQGMNAQDTIEFASAANALKHSIHGDALIATAAEVARLAKSSDGTVRMIR